jgi:hypothetical protein
MSDDIWENRGERRGVALSVRIPREIHEQLVASAKAADRSITQETVRQLQVAQLVEKTMSTGSWPAGYYVMTSLDTGKWRAPKLWLEVIDQAELQGVYEANAVGIEGDWSSDPQAYRAAMAATVRRLLQLLPGEFDLGAESGGVVKTMLEQALLSEHRRRTGLFPGGFVEQPEPKKDAAA